MWIPGSSQVCHLALHWIVFGNCRDPEAHHISVSKRWFRNPGFKNSYQQITYSSSEVRILLCPWIPFQAPTLPFSRSRPEKKNEYILELWLCIWVHLHARETHIHTSQYCLSRNKYTTDLFFSFILQVAFPRNIDTILFPRGIYLWLEKKQQVLININFHYINAMTKIKFQFSKKWLLQLDICAYVHKFHKF